MIATLMRPEGQTGVQTVVKSLHIELTRQGYDSVVITPFSASKVWRLVFAIRPIILERLNGEWSARWYRHWHYRALKSALSQHFKRYEGDIVLANCPLSARAALENRERRGSHEFIAMVCHFNGSQADELVEKGEITNPTLIDSIYQLEKAVLEAVDHVIFVSNWSRTIVEDRGICPRSASVIWNGIQPEHTSPGDLRKELGLSQNGLILVSVGTLEPRKNQIALLDLFKLISSVRTDAHLVLVGDGPDRHRLRGRLDQLGLRGSVTLTGERNDVPKILAAADLYIHYARSESFGLAVVEAARAGLPIAALPNGGIEEVMQVLPGSILLDEKNLQQSLNALLPLLTSESQRAAIGQELKSACERTFGVTSMANSYLDVFCKGIV